ncbi:hypothetical protein SAMN05216464_1318 [Mucilaginibacter pineti]|uniref:Uncharacterized protein n=1 Tax=Mucilaginibacter pineti TaxID=1391627 RepID=A0A1G7NY80_9SPHI|nr:hypothetical protein [Mucilaginibacter pineti]SDF78933.1 hypothetical protein SAMN05216464_1318 [Mucilaginibacter pineti]
MQQLPIPENEEARLKTLHNYQILNSLAEDEFDRITELASNLRYAYFTCISVR